LTVRWPMICHARLSERTIGLLSILADINY
jgi:hypothetical protein